MMVKDTLMTLINYVCQSLKMIYKLKKTYKNKIIYFQESTFKYLSINFYSLVTIFLRDSAYKVLIVKSTY